MTEQKTWSWRLKGPGILFLIAALIIGFLVGYGIDRLL